MVDDALRRVGLTNAQYAVLAMLEDEGALSSAELARRAAHPHHGRILQTSLTEHGRSLVAAAHERVQAVEARMVAGLSEHERYDLVWLLRECARALAPTGGAGHASHQATPIPAGSPDTTQDRRSS